MILIDSDILIWILRGREEIRTRFLELSENAEIRLFITPVHSSEIYAGLKEKERIDTALFLESIPCLGIDAKTGKLSGEYLNQYQKSHGITLADALISACAKINGLRLWTMNRKHYPMMTDSDFVD